MIHIMVPSYRTLTDPDDPFNKFTVYDIHVNGVFHASVRYNLLYSLHERLVAAFGFRFKAPEFPPKKVWKLDSKSLNERREGLAKYLQGVIANPDVHIIVERTFLEFQVKSFSESISRAVRLEIFLPDGRAVNVDCNSEDPTNAVMEKFVRVIGMNEKNHKYFGLFLARTRESRDDDGNGNDSSSSDNSSIILFDVICVRWLRNHESPFISQQLANKQFGRFKIVVRRVIWDPSLEEPLLDDPGSIKVLYLQAVNDIQKGLLKIPAEVKDKLVVLQEYGDFKQFLRLCHLQPDYGFDWLAQVSSDFPQEGTICELKIGRRQLLFEYTDEEGTLKKSKLCSKRIRVWRVSHADGQSTSEMTFQLEYLLRRDEFATITLHTDQAVLLSLFLQSIADEILQNQDKQPNHLLDDDIPSRAAEALITSKTNSVVADFSNSNGTSANGLLLRLISYQMPFLDHETFEDVTDADL